MSLRARITLAAAGAVAAVAVALGLVGYFSTRTQLIDQIRRQLSQLAAPRLQPHGPGREAGGGGGGGAGGGGAGGGGGGGGGCQAQGLFQNHPNVGPGGAPGYFQSVCPNGETVADEGGTPELPVTPAVLAIARRAQGTLYFDAHVQGTHVEILAVGDPPDHKAVEVALPLTQVDSVLSGLLVTYLLLIGGAVLLAGAAGLIIARAALAPIRRFSSETEQVTSQLDRPRRLEETGAEELRRLAASFNQTLDALERSVEAQRHLIADASHELRTPMAALRSNIQIFLEADRLPEEDRLDLQQSIMAELDDLTQLVSDVLELARGSAPSEQVEPVDLDLLVREAVDRTRRRAPAMRVELDIEPTAIVNSPERVSRAVANVIDNARKWSPAEGAIEVSLRDGVLTVRDHGPGFADQDLAHVFDRFFRSDEARRMPGSGLGLAIVKQTAEAHGGFATAANAPDGGAVVRVSFGPVVGASAEAGVARSRARL